MREYTCDVCGRVGPWGPGWAWWPRQPISPMTDPEPQTIVCSPECQDQAPFGRVRK